MNVVYYAVFYFRRTSKSDPKKERIEIFLTPFPTQSKAEEYKKKLDAHYGKRVYFSAVKKVDLAKHEKGIWIK